MFRNLSAVNKILLAYIVLCLILWITLLSIPAVPAYWGFSFYLQGWSAWIIFGWRSNR